MAHASPSGGCCECKLLLATLPWDVVRGSFTQVSKILLPTAADSLATRDTSDLSDTSGPWMLATSFIASGSIVGNTVRLICQYDDEDNYYCVEVDTPPVTGIPQLTFRIIHREAGVETVLAELKPIDGDYIFRWVNGYDVGAQEGFCGWMFLCMREGVLSAGVGSGAAPEEDDQKPAESTIMSISVETGHLDAGTIGFRGPLGGGMANGVFTSLYPFSGNRCERSLRGLYAEGYELPRTIEVTLEGFTGDFVNFNDTWTLDFSDGAMTVSDEERGCVWGAIDLLPDPDMVPYHGRIEIHRRWKRFEESETLDRVPRAAIIIEIVDIDDNPLYLFRGEARFIGDWTISPANDQWPEPFDVTPVFSDTVVGQVTLIEGIFP